MFWSHGLWLKNIKLVWWCHQLLSGFLVKGHLPRVSDRSLKIRVIMKWSREAVHRSPGIFFTAEENPGKPQLGDHLMKGLCDQSSPQMGSLSSKWGRQDRTAHQEGRSKELRKGRDIFPFPFLFVKVYCNILLQHKKSYILFNLPNTHHNTYPLKIHNKANTENWAS